MSPILWASSSFQKITMMPWKTQEVLSVCSINLLNKFTEFKCLFILNILSNVHQMRKTWLVLCTKLFTNALHLFFRVWCPILWVIITFLVRFLKLRYLHSGTKKSMKYRELDSALKLQQGLNYNSVLVCTRRRTIETYSRISFSSLHYPCRKH
jgi:hypothetical protein